MEKKVYIYFLIFISTLFSCDIDDNTSTNNTTEEEVESTENIKYLALGDSYTIGQGVEDHERWPNKLVEELEAKDINVESFEIIAQTGWRTSNLINAIEAEDPQDFNLVSLLIGVNNQYNGQAFDIFISEFNVLIQKSINIAGDKNRVFVVSIPDYGVTPFGNSFGNPDQIASEIDMYNNYMMQRCEELNIPFINITEISRNLEGSESALASDGLHPSGSQYNLWVDEIFPVVLELVSN